MLIPLGILAASGAGAGSYELIETITVGAGGAASVTFSNLNTYSTTYQHLQIRATLRSNRADTNDYVRTWFNGVKTSGNYKAHFLGGNGSVAFSSHFGESDVLGLQPSIQANNNTTGSFGALVIDILDPYETTKNTTIRALLGHTGSVNHVGLASGVFLSTNAITSYELAPWFGSGWIQGSRFSIYGLKAS